MAFGLDRSLFDGAVGGDATALNALVTTDGAFELVLPMLLVGYKAVLGMISLGWLGLYQYKCACAVVPFWR